ncbi:MAG: hypothetical protein WCJ35_14680 [Planctomycetota bacterium]
MSNDRKRDQKRKKKLAEEKKRKAYLAESLVYMGSKYQTEELTPTWMHTEVGIYETYDLLRTGQASRVINACHLLVGEISEPSSEVVAELSEVIKTARRSLITGMG